MADMEHKKHLAHQLANRTSGRVALETGILSLITLTAIIGNSCVLYVFYKSPHLRKVVSYYIITLAIGDIILALGIYPLIIATSAAGKDMIGAKAGQITSFFTFALFFGSLQTTMLISVNRFFCVVKPSIYRKYFNPKPAILMIVGIWITSILFVSLFYFSNLIRFKFNPGNMTYLMAFGNHTETRLFGAITQCVFVFVPLIITVVCYGKIYRVVKEHSNNVSANLNARHHGTNGSSLTMEDIHITKSVLALVCGFIICWIPSSTIWHLSLYFNLPRTAELTTTVTACASSAINPILYNIFNNPFRKQFLKTFCLARRARVEHVNVLSPINRE